MQKKRLGYTHQNRNIFINHYKSIKERRMSDNVRDSHVGGGENNGNNENDWHNGRRNNRDGPHDGNRSRRNYKGRP